MNIQYIMGYDESSDSRESVGVIEVLRFEDLMYGLYMDGELKQTRTLSKEEAIDKFGKQMSEESINKILNR